MNAIKWTGWTVIWSHKVDSFVLIIIRRAWQTTHCHLWSWPHGIETTGTAQSITVLLLLAWPQFDHSSFARRPPEIKCAPRPRACTSPHKTPQAKKKHLQIKRKPPGSNKWNTYDRSQNQNERRNESISLKHWRAADPSFFRSYSIRIKYITNRIHKKRVSITQMVAILES